MRARTPRRQNWGTWVSQGGWFWKSRQNAFYSQHGASGKGRKRQKCDGTGDGVRHPKRQSPPSAMAQI